MASTQAISLMASQLPPGFTDVTTIIANGERDAVNVIGFVTDLLPPAPTTGSDMQMKFVLKDNGSSLQGLTIKFFKAHEKDLPQISTGDVVLLRYVKVTNQWRGLSGLSNHRTQHVCFPKDSIVSPDFRINFQVHGRYMPHTRSSGADNPSIHEQQWIITLNEYHKTSNSSIPQGIKRAIEPLPTRPGINGMHTLPAKPANTNVTGTAFRAEEIPARTKFSLVKDIKIPQSSKGIFCDLVGEVVKIFVGAADYVDLYITDYTFNAMLFDYPKIDDAIPFGQRDWPGPAGKMTLHVELMSPHGFWAQRNVKPGDLVSLRNVRVKYNNSGHAQGNMWPDPRRDAIDISFLLEHNPQHGDLIARKEAYMAQQGRVNTAKTANGPSKKNGKAKLKREATAMSKREKKKMRAEEEERKARGAKSDGSDSEVESNKDSNAGSKHVKSLQSNDMPTGYIFNKSVKHNHLDIPRSSFADILSNPHRLYTSPHGTTFEMTFVNAKHRARFRVVDFYPHNLRDFCRAVPSASDPGRITWEWDFWLVLRGGAQDEQDNTEGVCINCSVKGAEAATLIGQDIRPQDFTRQTATQALSQLEERLFYLWGDLKERKDNFLHAHPHIKPDDEFSALAYNISSSHLPFEACVFEFGVDLSGAEGGGVGGGGGGGVGGKDGEGEVYEGRWARVYGLCDTEIEG